MVTWVIQVGRLSPSGAEYSLAWTEYRTNGAQSGRTCPNRETTSPKRGRTSCNQCRTCRKLCKTSPNQVRTSSNPCRTSPKCGRTPPKRGGENMPNMCSSSSNQCRTSSEHRQNIVRMGPDFSETEPNIIITECGRKRV